MSDYERIENQQSGPVGPLSLSFSELISYVPSTMQDSLKETITNKIFNNNAFVNIAADAYIRDLTDRQVRNSLKPRIPVSFQLSTSDKEKLIEMFPGYKLDFRDLVHNPHGYAAALRNIREHAIMAEITNRGKLYPKNKRCLVKNIGGNATRIFSKNMEYVHVCFPVISAEDLKRHAVFNDFLSRCNRQKLSQFQQLFLDSYINDDDRYICGHKFQDCPIQADYIIAIHVPDISLKNIARGMVLSNAKIYFGTVPYSPDLFVFRQGVIPGLDMHFVRYQRGNTTMIRFYFKDGSNDYVHNYSDYMKFFTTTGLEYNGYLFLTELVDLRGGECFFKVYRTSHPNCSVSLSRTLPINTDDYLVLYTIKKNTVHNSHGSWVYWKALELTDSNRVSSAVYSYHRMVLNKKDYNDVLKFAVSLSDTAFTYQKILSYCNSIGSKAWIAGTTAIEPDTTRDADYVQLLAQAIYLIAYQARWSHTQAIRDEIVRINTLRDPWSLWDSFLKFLGVRASAIWSANDAEFANHLGFNPVNSSEKLKSPSQEILDDVSKRNLNTHSFGFPAVLTFTEEFDYMSSEIVDYDTNLGHRSEDLSLLVASAVKDHFSSESQPETKLPDTSEPPSVVVFEDETLLLFPREIRPVTGDGDCFFNCLKFYNIQIPSTEYRSHIHKLVLALNCQIPEDFGNILLDKSDPNSWVCTDWLPLISKALDICIQLYVSSSACSPNSSLLYNSKSKTRITLLLENSHYSPFVRTYSVSTGHNCPAPYDLDELVVAVEQAETDTRAQLKEDEVYIKTRDQAFPLPKPQSLNHVCHSGPKLMDLLSKSDVADKVVLDLGSGPGAWTKVCLGWSCRHIDTVTYTLSMDIPKSPRWSELGTLEVFENREYRRHNLLSGKIPQGLRESYDLILCDYASNTADHPAPKHVKDLDFLDLYLDRLVHNGTLVLKMFSPEVPETKLFVSNLAKNFSSLRLVQPAFTRPLTKEFYLVCTGYGNSCIDWEINYDGFTKHKLVIQMFGHAFIQNYVLTKTPISPVYQDVNQRYICPAAGGFNHTQLLARMALKTDKCSDPVSSVLSSIKNFFKPSTDLDINVKAIKHPVPQYCADPSCETLTSVLEPPPSTCVPPPPGFEHIILRRDKPLLKPPFVTPDPTLDLVEEQIRYKHDVDLYKTLDSLGKTFGTDYTKMLNYQLDSSPKLGVTSTINFDISKLERALKIYRPPTKFATVNSDMVFNLSNDKSVQTSNFSTLPFSLCTEFFVSTGRVGQTQTRLTSLTKPVARGSVSFSGITQYPVQPVQPVINHNPVSFADSERPLRSIPLEESCRFLVKNEKDFSDVIKDYKGYLQHYIDAEVQNFCFLANKYSTTNHSNGLCIDFTTAVVAGFSGGTFACYETHPESQPKRICGSPRARYSDYRYFFDMDTRTFKSWEYISSIGRKHVLVSDFTYSFLDKKFLDLAKTVKVSDRKFKYALYQAGPGCGKTHTCINLIRKLSEKENFFVLQATRDAVGTVKNRLSNVGRTDINKCRTIHSFLANPSQVDYLFLDEVGQSHPGMIALAIIVGRPKYVFMFGDAHQIPFVNRAKTYNLSYKSYTQVFEHTEALTQSFRCTRKAIGVLNSVYDPPLQAMSGVVGDEKFIRIDSLHQVPKSGYDVYLVYTQDDLGALKNWNYDPVYTVHGFQGSEADKVAIVRLNAMEGEDIYTRKNYAVVAMSRHRRSLHYYSVIDDSTDALRIFVSKTNCVPLAGGYDEFSALSGDTSQIISVVKYSKNVEKPIEKVSHSFSREFILPITGLALTTRNLRELNLITGPLGVMSHPLIPYSKLARTYSQLSDKVVLLDPPLHNSLEVINFVHSFKNYMSFHYDVIPSLDYDRRLEPLPVFSYDFGSFDLEVLQHYHNMIFPKDFRTDTANDTLMIHLQPLQHSCVEVGWSPARDYYTERSWSTASPALKTNIQDLVPRSVKECLLALQKRNQLVPSNEGINGMDSTVDLLFNSFLTVLVPEARDHTYPVIKLHPDMVTDWLLKQPKETRAALEAMPPLRLIDGSLYDFIIKRNPKPSLKDGSAMQHSALQTVMSMPKYLNALFCPIFTEVRNRLLSAMRKNIKIFTLLDPDAFADCVSEIYPPKRYFDRRPHVYEVDISKFDKSQGLMALTLECRLLRFFGVDSRLVAAWEHYHTATRFKDYASSLFGRINYQRKSGDALTFLGNTMFLISVIGTAIDLDTVDFAAFAGDDSIVFGGIERYPLDTEFFTCTFNLAVKFFRYSSLHFCSKFLIPVNEKRWAFVPDPLKFLVKLGRRDLRNQEHIDEYAVSASDTVKHYGNLYIARPLADAVIERYRLTFDPIYLIWLLYLAPNHFDKLFSLPKNQIFGALPNLD